MAAGFVNPPVSFHFRVRVGNLDGELGFQSVEGLNAKVGQTTHAEGGENTFTHHLPDRTDYGDLTLVRGMVIGSALISWFNDAIQDFKFDPRDVVVTLLNEKHEPLDQWTFINAWPKGWDIENFDAQNGKVAIEKIILTYQYFRRGL